MGSFRKCSTIRQIVRLRQMLRRWRARACGFGGGGGKIPSDVPVGHLAVCVGSNSRRFVVRATYLNHPLFRKLLVQAEEEYGFDHTGPIAIPCEEATFEEILRHLGSWSTACNAGARGVWQYDSAPLLRGYDKSSSVW